MVRCEVKSTDVRENRGTGKRGPYVIRKQSGYLDVGKAYPVEVAIRLEDGEAALPPGWYEITPECFYVKQFGEIGVDLSKMRPSKAGISRAV